MIQKLVSVFLILSVLVISTSAASTTTLENNKNNQSSKKEKAEKELLQLQSEIKNLQKNLKSKQKQQSNAVIGLQSAEKQIATASKILRSTKRQLTQKERELKKSRLQQANLENNKNQQKKALASQIKSAFISGRQEYLKMLLNQEDPEALGRMLVYYDYMNKARSEKVLKLQQTLVELENIEKIVQKEITELNLLKKSNEEETQRLDKLKDNRKKLVASLAKEIASKSEKLTELEINAKELQVLIDSVQQAIGNIDFAQPLEGLNSVKGKLNWPANGKQSQSYGSQISEGLTSNGVIISAPEGNSVNAVYYGRIVYADWLRGFGLLVIIDHGKGYMSLYGYNQALYKQVGDWVEAKESIATVGQSGGQPSPGLYFEMRHNGKPFNPKKWFHN